MVATRRASDPQPTANFERRRALVHGVEVQRGHAGAAQLVTEVCHHVQPERLDAGRVVAERLLTLAEACESSDDVVFNRTAGLLHLSSQQINLAHLQALAWADQLGD